MADLFPLRHPWLTLDRLDLFDAVGSRAYGGPALMGDARVGNF